MALDIFLLLYLYTHRTYDLAASPWLQLGPLFFVVYTLATLLLFYNYKSTRGGQEKLSAQNIILTSLHFFVGISVAAIIYPLGYGFDAFIHRATESWIQTHGNIFPKQPYYIGQYSLVVLLSNITQIKISFIDIWLVPVLSAILVPSIVITTLKKITNSSSPLIYISFWILACVPFLSLHLTTPHNLVLLFTVLIVFLNFSYTKKQIPFHIPFFASCAALVTHPLIGAPVFIFTLTVFLIQKFKNNKKAIITFLILIFISLCLLLPAMFTLNGLRIGKSLPTLSNPITHISSFVDLFQRPYWYADTSPLRFEILYIFERLIVPIVLLLALYGFIQYRKSAKSGSASGENLVLWIFPITALGLFIDAFLLRSWIIFPDVVAYEQGDYPMRLIYTSIIFLLPFAMYGFYSLYQLCTEKIKAKKIFEYSLLILIPIILTLTLYLSYPQRNTKVRFPGYNVTQSDFKAIEWIHNKNPEYNYIVLSNQLVSAAALTNYSFAKYFDTPSGQMFYYSIPTGGKLYQYYGKMIYEGQKREYMENAMKTVNVHKAYFVVNKYWANADKIIAGAKQTADSFHVINDTIWIFEYTS